MKIALSLQTRKGMMSRIWMVRWIRKQGMESGRPSKNLISWRRIWIGSTSWLKRRLLKKMHQLTGSWIAAGWFLRQSDYLPKWFRKRHSLHKFHHHHSNWVEWVNKTATSYTSKNDSKRDQPLNFPRVVGNALSAKTTISRGEKNATDAKSPKRPKTSRVSLSTFSRLRVSSRIPWTVHLQLYLWDSNSITARLNWWKIGRRKG